MTNNFSQTEYRDIVLMEPDNNNMKAGGLVIEKNTPTKKHSNDIIEKNWHAGYIPPYRAAFHRGAN
ncbi:MAG: hypothetical protein FD173_1861 [Gallionellaceae bacterium]|nr:MAG: hypothetical protein FD173_1861 [Gallionellaceae bacterium]